MYDIASTPFSPFTAIVIFAARLNCTNRHFCCLCVWFIAELSKLGSLRALPSFRHLPRLSSVVQRLERANARNANASLLVSDMFSVVILVGVFMSGNGARDTVMVLTMFTVPVVGLVTFAALLAGGKPGTVPEHTVVSENTGNSKNAES